MLNRLIPFAFVAAAFAQQPAQQPSATPAPAAARPGERTGKRVPLFFPQEQFIKKNFYCWLTRFSYGLAID